MKWIFCVLKFLRLVPAFTVDDVLNADSENSLREHAQVVSDVKEAAVERARGNDRLRAALIEARQQIASFNPIGDFERALHHNADISPHERPGRVRKPSL
jgi:hypothetical protein